jgi:hypothetical protein
MLSYRILTAATLHWGLVLAAAFCLTIVLSVLVTIHETVQDTEIVWSGSCEFVRWAEAGSLTIIANCGEQGEYFISDQSTVASYVQNPGPLSCSVSALGTGTCAMRPTAE